MGCVQGKRKISMHRLPSKIDELRSKIITNTSNEDDYYDSYELASIDNTSFIEQAKLMTPAKKISWVPGETLGQGSFGRVIAAMNQKSGQLMACKQVLITSNSEDKVLALEMEIEVLSLLQHKNIVSYYGMEKSNEMMNIFIEYVAGGSLTQMINKFGKFSEQLVKAYVRQILEGLDYLHSHGIMHRDIKGGNILIDGNGICKLADFGSSIKLSKVNNEISGTPQFMAPEVVRQAKPGRKADIWSLGCTIIEMMTGKPPWSNMTNIFAIMIKVGKGEIPQYPVGISDDARDFLNKCLDVDPNLRWNARKLQQHQFLIKKQSETPLKISANKSPIKSKAKQRTNFQFSNNGQQLKPPSQNEIVDRPPELSPTNKISVRSRSNEEQNLEEHNEADNLIKQRESIWILE